MRPLYVKYVYSLVTVKIYEANNFHRNIEFKNNIADNTNDIITIKL